MTGRWRGFTLIELIIVLAIIAIIAVIAVPNIIAARKMAHHSSAIASLRSIHAAETMFREGDADKDLNFDYGSMEELSSTGLLDGVLGAGSKAGYLFQATYATASSEYFWYAVANPALPTITGDIYFATNWRGVIFYTQASSQSINDVDCTIPPELLPIYSR